MLCWNPGCTVRNAAAHKSSQTVCLERQGYFGWHIGGVMNGSASLPTLSCQASSQGKLLPPGTGTSWFCWQHLHIENANFRVGWAAKVSREWCLQRPTWSCACGNWNAFQGVKSRFLFFFFGCLILVAAWRILSCSMWVLSVAACGIFSCSMQTLTCNMWHLVP